MTDDTDTVVNDLVARCVEDMETEGEGAVERVCAAHPDLAGRIRSRLAQLRRLGLLRGDAQPVSVGPYRVLEELGSGGMGTVYLAEQTEPVQRRVAVKVVKIGMDTREVVRRFEAERQALAMMNHPCIARVFEAGATDEGRPYFAMEYVDGAAITDYCDRHGLTTEARLELFARVCDAVQHAHQKGILHRDLKPSNVLVTEVDGVPVPKVIDFGIAKATGADLTEGTLVTQPGQVIGTPEYMSPEQARSGEIDTRTDVYSLGVILYELLCGELPFDSRRLRRADLFEMHRILQEEVPRTPSLRVAGSEFAASRGMEPSTLQRRLRGDLDWITLRALEKDPEHRYPSARQLGDDVRRHLSHEAVHATPPSVWYGARKFVRRHRVAVTAAGAVVVMLVAGLLTSTWFWLGAEQAHGETRTFYKLARNAVDELLVRIAEERLQDLPQMSNVRRELMEEALRFYQGLLAQRSSDPQLRMDVAWAYDRAAEIYGDLGRHADAEEARRHARAIIEELLRSDPGHRAVRGLQAVVEANHANDLKLAGKIDDARAALRSALEMFSGLADASGEGETYRVQEAAAWNNLGLIEEDNDPKASAPAYRRAIALLQAEADASPKRAGVRYRLAIGRTNLASALLLTGEVEAAGKEFDAAIAGLDALLESGGERPDFRRAVANTRTRFAGFLRRTGRSEQAITVLRSALADWNALRQRFPDEPLYQNAAAGVHHSIALAMQQRSEPFDEVRRHYEAAIQIREALVERHARPDHVLQLARGHGNLAGILAREVLAGRGRPEDRTDAEEAVRRAIELLDGLVAGQGTNSEVLMTLGSYSQILGMLLDGDGRRDEASRRYAVALQSLETVVGQQPDHAEYRDKLATLLMTLGRRALGSGDGATARKHAEAGLAHLQKALAINDKNEEYLKNRISMQLLLAEALVACGEPAPAAAAAERLVRLAPRSPDARGRAGRILLACARLAGEGPAAATLRERALAALQAAERGWAAMAPRTGGLADFEATWAEAHAALGRCLRDTGARADGREHLAEAVAGHQRAVSGSDAGPRHAVGLRVAAATLIEALLEDGETGEVQRRCRELAKALPGDPAAVYAAARGLARAGDHDLRGEVLGLLQREVLAGFRPPVDARTDPAFAWLAGDAAFGAAVARLGR